MRLSCSWHGSCIRLPTAPLQKIPKPHRASDACARHSSASLSLRELHAGVQGQAWATYVPAEGPPADGSKPRGATVFARDFQTVVIYDSKGQFVGVRRPGSGLPIEVLPMSRTSLRKRENMHIASTHDCCTCGGVVHHHMAARTTASVTCSISGPLEATLLLNLLCSLLVLQALLKQ